MLRKSRTVQDRLVHYINRFTIRSILFTCFALVIVLGVLMAGITEWSEDQAVGALDRFITVDNEISDLCLNSITAMSNARRNEKDFILSYRDFGFNEAKSRYLSRALANIADVTENMKKIRRLADDPEVTRQAAEVEQAIGQYQDRLLVMVDKYGTLGSYNSGLEHAFRDTAHEMEGLLERHKSDRLVADLLSMRRREKDFIERNRDGDVALFHEAAVRFRTDVAQSGLPPGLKGELGKLADTYRSGFEEYVKTTEEIRTIKSGYLKSVQVIEPTLEKLYVHFDRKFNETLVRVKNNERLFNMIKAGTGVLALLVSLVVALVIAMVISKSVEENKTFAEQIAGGNLQNRLAPQGKNEFATLARALNGMAESLHNADLARAKWTAELRKSEEEVRKLNQDLELKVAERTRQLIGAQEELVSKEKQAMLGLIAGNMGNELRNPLGVMNNAVFFLKSVVPEADEIVREYLGIIGNEIDNSQRIISDLLDFTLNKTPNMKLISVHELVRQSLGRCVIPESVQMQADLPETLPRVNVDPLQMEKVFKHLAINAVQAMPEGGALRISARKVRGMRSEERGTELILEPQASFLEPDLVEISIEDTGVGIAPENMNKLFQPLFTTKSRGIGLGLAFTKNLTEANGGRIEVESRLGAGTTFTVILPVKEL